jgi:fucose 4-O-acetylase-like acetyltransferase
MNKIISFLQVFGIILVVIGHINTPSPFPTLSKWLGAFHMPLFMFISGYLFSNTTQKKVNGFIEVVRKKSYRLLIPYFIISVSWIFFLKIISDTYSGYKLEDFILYILQSLFYPDKNPIVQYWFLPTLFLIFIFSFYLQKVTQYNCKFNLYALIFLAFLSYNSKVFDINFFSINLSFYYLFYFWYGYCFKLFFQEKIEYFLKKKCNFGVIFILLFLLSLLPVFYDTDIPIIIPLVGIHFSFLLAILYAKYIFSFFNHLNGFTYIIYLFSWIPQILTRIMYPNIDLKLGVISIITAIYFPYFLGRFLLNIRRQYNINRFVLSVFGL